MPPQAVPGSSLLGAREDPGLPLTNTMAGQPSVTTVGTREAPTCSQWALPTRVLHRHPAG